MPQLSLLLLLLAMRWVQSSSFHNSLRCLCNPLKEFIRYVYDAEYLQIQEVYDEAGLWGFWRGVFPTLIMVRNNLLLHVPTMHH